MTDEAAATLGNTVAGFLCALGKELAVVDQVLADLVEAIEAARRGHDIRRRRGLAHGHAEEVGKDVGASLEGQRVGNGRVQARDLGIGDLPGLHGGGRGGVAQDVDEGLDGGDGLGEVGIFGQQAVVCSDNAGSLARAKLVTWSTGGSMTYSNDSLLDLAWDAVDEAGGTSVGAAAS